MSASSRPRERNIELAEARYRQRARALCGLLLRRGFALSLDSRGERLRIIGPIHLLPDDLAEDIIDHQYYLLQMLTAAASPAIAWRLRAMLPQVPLAGPLAPLMARLGPHAQGHCWSCGDLLPPDDRSPGDEAAVADRCRPCRQATGLAFSRVREGRRVSRAGGPPPPRQAA
jgi:predicted nucleic acid-binding Zn ribbon protein